MVCFLGYISQVQWLIKDVQRLPPKEMGAQFRVCWADSLRPRTGTKQTNIFIEREPWRMLHLAFEWLCWDWLSAELAAGGGPPNIEASSTVLVYFILQLQHFES